MTATEGWKFETTQFVILSAVSIYCDYLFWSAWMREHNAVFGEMPRDQALLLAGMAGACAVILFALTMVFLYAAAAVLSSWLERLRLLFDNARRFLAARVSKGSRIL